MDIRREEGVALVIAMMAMLLMMALGLALVLTISSETLIATSFRNNGEAFYAADAVLERAMDDLVGLPDWNAPLNGLAPVRVHRRSARRFAHAGRRLGD